MIKEIIKRDGTTEVFDAEKVNGWGIWAAEHLGKHVNWADVVLNTVSTLPAKCSSVMLQDVLIGVCLIKRTWSYNRMAGRLYAAKLTKDIMAPINIPVCAICIKKWLVMVLSINHSWTPSANLSTQN